MAIKLVLGLSTVFQLIAVVLALRLIPVTGRAKAWLLISAALVLMSLRRVFLVSVTLLGISVSAELISRLVGLAISLMFMLGMVYIRALMLTIRQSHEALSRTQTDLEHLVEQRTADLTEATRTLQINEARYRAVIEDQTEMICRYRPDFTLTFANDAYCRGCGIPYENLIGTCFLPVLPEKNRAFLLEHLALLTLDNPVNTDALAVDTPAGEQWLEWTNRAIYDDSGQVIEYQSVGRDITERKRAAQVLQQAHDLLEQKVEERTAELQQANRRLEQMLVEQWRTEEALRLTESKYRDMFENGVIGIFQSTLSGQFISVNPRFAAMLGYDTPEDVIADINSIGDDIYVRSETYREITGVLTTTNQVVNFEAVFRRRDGSIWTGSFNARLVRDEDDTPLYIEGFVEDITARKQAEQARLESDQRFKLLYERAPLGLQSLDVNGFFIDVNKTWLDTLGYERDEVIGRWFGDFLTPDDRVRFEDAFPDFKAAGEISGLIYEMVRKDGTVITTEFSSKITYDGHGTFERTNCIFTDVTERMRMEEALRESEEMFRSIVRQSVDGIIIVDERGAILEWNQSMVQITGLKYEEVVGRLVWDIQHSLALESGKTPENYERSKASFFDFIQTGQGSWLSQTFEREIVCPDGTHRIVQSSPFPIRRERGILVGSVNRDVTEKKQAEAALSAQRAFLRQIIDAAPDLIFVKDLDSRYLLVNKALANYGGTTVERMIGKTDAELLLDQGFVAGVVDDDGTVIQTGNTLFIPEQKYISPGGGETRWFQTTKIPLRSAGGEIASLLGVSTDITERKWIEQALKESEERHRVISDLISDYAYSCRVEPDGKLVLEWTTGSLKRIAGYAPAGTESRDSKTGAADSDDLPLLGIRFERLLTGERDIGEMQIVTSQGKIRWLRVYGHPVWDDSQQRVVRIFGAAQDITDQRAAEGALRENEARMRAVLTSMPDILLRLNRRGEYLEVYTQDESLLAVPRDRVIGHSIADTMPPEVAEPAMTCLEKAFETGETQLLEYSLPVGRGECYFEARFVSSHPEEVLIIVRDITDRRQAEAQALELALEKERSHILAEFVTNASHEFATPLSVIKTGLYLLNQGQLPEQLGRQLNVVDEQVLHIEHLIEGLITMSRLDSGTDFNVHPVDLNRMVQDIFVRIESLAADRQQTLVFEAAPDLPTVMGDVNYLYRALMNILDNALKFAPGGAITVRTYKDDHHVVVAITDTGIGIASTELPHVFDRFYRADPARSARGTGLGLSIARKIVEAHYGIIDVESVFGEGSTFRVYLPIPDK